MLLLFDFVELPKEKSILLHEMLYLETYCLSAIALSYVLEQCLEFIPFTRLLLKAIGHDANQAISFLSIEVAIKKVTRKNIVKANMSGKSISPKVAPFSVTIFKACVE